jgi:hypothetical protein
MNKLLLVLALLVVPLASFAGSSLDELPEVSNFRPIN